MSYKRCSGGLGPTSSDWSQNSVGEGGGGGVIVVGWWRADHTVVLDGGMAGEGMLS